MQCKHLYSFVFAVVLAACGGNPLPKEPKLINTETHSASNGSHTPNEADASLRLEDSQKHPSEMADVSSLIGKNQTVVLQKNGDLTGTGTHNSIVVVQNNDDIKSRTLLILGAADSGVLRVIKSAENAIPCADCGALEVRLQDIFIESKGFTIKVSGGARNKEENEYSFRYSKIDDTWQLVKVVLASIDTLNPNNNRKFTKTPKDFGKVDISAFDLEDYSK